MQPGRDGTDHWDDPHRHRGTFGRELREWYERRGLTLRGLGDLLDCGSAVIHRATQGRDWLAPWTVVRADWCLDADRRLVESFAECWLREQQDVDLPGRGKKARRAARHHRDRRLLLDPEEEALGVVELSAQIVATVACLTPEMKRRVFVKWATAGAASLPLAAMAGGLEEVEHLALGTDPAGRADAVAAEQIRDTIGLCRQLDDLGRSAAVLGMGRRTLVRVDELLRGCTSPAARRPLTLLAGELSQVVGYAAANVRDEETAARLTARALAAADEAGSAELHAYTVSLNVAHRELYCREQCDLAAAADAAAAAQEWARLSGNPAVISHAHSVAACAHAKAGRDLDALRALDSAEGYLERSTPEERPGWLYWYGRTVLLGHRGRCLLDLHRAGRRGAARLDTMVDAFRGELAARGAGYPRDRAYDLLDLADAYWLHGEREESARHASDALVLAAGMERRRIRELLEDIHGRMEGHPLPAVRDFHERFSSLIPG